MSKQVVVRRDVICDEGKLGIPQVDKSESLYSRPDTLKLQLSPHDDDNKYVDEPQRSNRDTRRPIRFGIDELCSSALD